MMVHEHWHAVAILLWNPVQLFDCYGTLRNNSAPRWFVLGVGRVLERLKVLLLDSVVNCKLAYYTGMK